MKTVLTPERYMESPEKRNPDMSEITSPILEREHKKNVRVDFAMKILSGEYDIVSAFQGWPDGEFKYEIQTKNGNVKWASQEFKNGYVICLVKKEGK